MNDDVKAGLHSLKADTALYVGGMGHRSVNFHHQLMTRRGFGEAADRIQDLYLAGRKDEAIEAVPDEWIDMKALVGPKERIRERCRAWADSGATSLILRAPDMAAVEAMAEVARAY